MQTDDTTATSLLDESLPALTRARFLAAGGVAVGALAVPKVFRTAAAHAAPALRSDLFTLGVASGDPLPRGVVLWTRLAPEPLDGGGMPNRPVPVRWEMIKEGTRRIARRGITLAQPNLAHSVHVEVDGLEPDTWYTYRFRVGSQETNPVVRARCRAEARSSTGCASPSRRARTTRTATTRPSGTWPRRTSTSSSTWATTSTSTGPRPRPGPARRRRGCTRASRSRASRATATAMHATRPIPSCRRRTRRRRGSSPGTTTRSRTTTRRDSRGERLTSRRRLPRPPRGRLPGLLRAPAAAPPRGPSLQLYRRFRFGDLAEFSILDTRQYRSDPALRRRAQELRGALRRGGHDDRARAGAVARRRPPPVGLALERDRPADELRRGRLQPAAGLRGAGGGLQRRSVGRLRRPARAPDRVPGKRRGAPQSGHPHGRHPLELGQRIKVDYDDPGSQTVATEFVGTSITSDFPAQFIATSPRTPQRATWRLSAALVQFLDRP